MIPKVIHYCWFGGKPLPSLAKKCIDSWKKYCPDYEIIEWNEQNFDVYSCDYTKEAYLEKKYAFVSDYARFKILYEHGGVYLDTDVELLKSLDGIINRGEFMGCEKGSDTEDVAVAPGLGMAAEKGSSLLKEFLDGYNNRHFIYNERIDLTTIVQYTTSILKKHGLVNTNDIQKIEKFNIYPKEYFNPMDMDTGRILLTENTVSIHHYAASWESKYNIFRGKTYRFIRRVFGSKSAEFVKEIFGRKFNI